MEKSHPRTGDTWKWWLAGCVGAAFLILFLPTFAVLAFYVEEDWRGAAAWEKAKSEIEADGTSLDPSSYIPAAIPDAENFGALPIFQVSADAEHPAYQKATALRAALEPITSRLPTSKEDEKSRKDPLPYLEKWMTGQKPDMAVVRTRLAAICREINPNAPVPGNASASELLAILCAELTDLRRENAVRPQCLFHQDCDAEPPINISFNPTVSLISLMQVLSYDERLALYDGNPLRALDDMAICCKCVAGLQKQPLLLSAIVANGLVAMQLVVVEQGLNDHNWNESQLSVIADRLARIDILADGRFAIAGDIVVFALPTMAYYEAHRRISPAELGMLREEFSSTTPSSDYLGRIAFWLIPKGWFDLDNALDIRFQLLGTAHLIDPAARRVFPDKEQALLHSYQGLHSHVFPDKPFLNPENSLNRSVKNFAYLQVQVDEARIACLLERYHLRHDGYPDSLRALPPEFGVELPRDIINGEPYHYELRSDGSYLLYSVGWNQEDDGGESVVSAGQVPQDAADWVWPNHFDQKKR
jgi:hypothetical protein